MTGSERLAVSLSGRVQGVGYRGWAAHRARLLGLTGWVANQPDGSVTAVAEGPRTALDVWLRDLQDGPMLAEVQECRATFSASRGEFWSFDVR